MPVENHDLVVVRADPSRQLRLKASKNEDGDNPEDRPSSYLLHRPLAHDSLGLEQQNEDQHDEGDRIAISRRSIADRHHLGKAENQAADHGAGIFPIPPSTAATNAFSPGITPIKGSIFGYSSDTRIPPAAARAEPNRESQPR